MDKYDRQPIFLKPSLPFSEKVFFEALSKVLSPELIERLLVQTGSLERRKRCLSARLMVYLVVAMTLYAHDSIPEVLNKLVEGLRFQGAYLLGKLLPVKSAIAQARQRLGVKVLVELFRTVAGPKAQANQMGAFYKGMRLTAFDGTTIALPDTPENERFFGRPRVRPRRRRRRLRLCRPPRSNLTGSGPIRTGPDPAKCSLLFAEMFEGL